jgi:hypothetical protein
VSTTVVPVAKFGAGVVDTGGKVTKGFIDTGGAPSLVNISANFEKILNDPNVIFRGFGKDDYEKDLKQKLSLGRKIYSIVSVGDLG